MRRKPSLPAQLIIGLLVGLTIVGGLFITTPKANAQLGGAVVIADDRSATSLKQLIEQTKHTWQNLQQINSQELTRLQMLEEYIKEGSRWLETVQHYAAMVEQNIKRFTTLKGILGFVEQELGLDEDTLQAMASIGNIVQGVFKIKEQLESLVTTRLRMLKSIEDRARAGIFNPSADLNDLEEYLRTSIGRSAQQIIATRARLAQFDNELERWTHDLTMYRERKRGVLKLKYETLELLKEETLRQARVRAVSQDSNGASVNSNPTGGRVSASSDAIAALNKQLFDCESELNRLDVIISDLITKIEARYKKYHMKFDDSRYDAARYQEDQDAWDDFLSIKDEAALEMLEGYHDDQVPTLKPRMRKR